MMMFTRGLLVVAALLALAATTRADTPNQPNNVETHIVQASAADLSNLGLNVFEESAGGSRKLQSRYPYYIVYYVFLPGYYYNNAGYYLKSYVDKWQSAYYGTSYYMKAYGFGKGYNQGNYGAQKYPGSWGGLCVFSSQAGASAFDKTLRTSPNVKKDFKGASSGKGMQTRVLPSQNVPAAANNVF